MEGPGSAPSSTSVIRSLQCDGVSVKLQKTVSDYKLVSDTPFTSNIVPGALLCTGSNTNANFEFTIPSSHLLSLSAVEADMGVSVLAEALETDTLAITVKRAGRVAVVGSTAVHTVSVTAMDTGCVSIPTLKASVAKLTASGSSSIVGPEALNACEIVMTQSPYIGVVVSEACRLSISNTGTGLLKVSRSGNTTSSTFTTHTTTSTHTFHSQGHPDCSSQYGIPKTAYMHIPPHAQQAMEQAFSILRNGGGTTFSSTSTTHIHHFTSPSTPPPPPPPTNPYPDGDTRDRVASYEVPDEEEEAVYEGGDKTQRLCVVCLCREPITVIIPCYHHVMCVHCSRQRLLQCPLCRKTIEGVKRIYS